MLMGGKNNMTVAGLGFTAGITPSAPGTVFEIGQNPDGGFEALTMGGTLKKLPELDDPHS